MIIKVGNLTFVKEFRNYMPCFVSKGYADDCYKVSKYGKKFFAYFKPDGWENFGNAVRYQGGNPKAPKSTEYGSLMEAFQDCVAHVKMYPAGAKEDNRLPINNK